MVRSLLLPHERSSKQILIPLSHRSLILAILAYVAWIPKLLHGLVCTSDATPPRDAFPSASTWPYTNAMLVTYMLFTLAHSASAVYHFAGAWRDGGSLNWLPRDVHRIVPMSSAPSQADVASAQDMVKIADLEAVARPA